MPNEVNTPWRKRRWRKGAGGPAAVVCCALLTACQHTPHPEPEPVPAPPTAQVDTAAPTGAAATASATASQQLPESSPLTTPVESAEESLVSVLRYAARLRTMNATDLRQELTTLGNQVPRNGTGATPGNGASPRAQMQLALALLQTREPVETARALGLLQRVATSTEPGARAYAALAQVLTDNLIATRRLEDSLERTSQQLRESQRRIDALNERLDAMRAIERSMNAPPPPLGPRPVRP